MLLLFFQRKQQDWAALHDRSIHQYESELGLYRQQILDFDKLSGIASDEMAYLRCEVESQTKKLRVIEEAWLHNVANSEQGDTAAASEKDVAAAVESWKRVVETERARWKASERAMESKLKSFKEQTQLLESLVHEKNMEMNKIREIQAAQEDRMQMYDVQKLKGVCFLLFTILVIWINFSLDVLGAGVRNQREKRVEEQAVQWKCRY